MKKINDLYVVYEDESGIFLNKEKILKIYLKENIFLRYTLKHNIFKKEKVYNFIVELKDLDFSLYEEERGDYWVIINPDEIKEINLPSLFILKKSVSIFLSNFPEVLI